MMYDDMNDGPGISDVSKAMNDNGRAKLLLCPRHVMSHLVSQANTINSIVNTLLALLAGLTINSISETCFDSIA
jgi:hypothetical protein